MRYLSYSYRAGLTGLVACALVAGSPALAAERENMVINGARTPLEADHIGSAISVIDADTIARRGEVLISDLLRDIPGVAVNRGGPPGALTQVRMRGAEGNHTLVMIDGVIVNDPASSGEFNFAHLLAAGVERVEVLRGPASALYGSEAIGGAINIITTDGGPRPEARISAEGGSFGTVTGHAGVSGGTQAIRGSASVSYYDTDGINTSRFGTEKDGYENITVNAKGRAKFGNLETTASIRYLDTTSEFDGADFTFGSPTFGLVVDTPGSRSEERQLYARAGARLTLFDGAWSHRLDATLADIKSDNFEADAFTNRIDSQRWEVSYQSSVRARTGAVEHRMTGAVEHETEKFANRPADPMALEAQERENDETSVIGEYHAGIAERLFLTAGIRHDTHDLFADATTYRTAVSYLVPGLPSRLHTSFAKGVTNPGFFELFGFFPAFFTGNPDLEPETSHSFDVGIEHTFGSDVLTADITYFTARLKDEIVTGFDPVTFLSTPENLDGKSHRKGVEASLQARLSDALRLSGTYTYTASGDPSGQWELRRPRHIASGNLDLSLLGDRLHLNLGADYTGTQLDTDFSTGDRVRLDDFLLVDLAASYSLSDRLTLRARVENLLDTDYEEVFSFRSPGIGAFAGVTLRIGG